VQDIAKGVPIQTVLARKREAMSEEGVAELEEKLLPAASNVDPIVLQELERVRGKLIAFKTEHGYPNTAVYRTPGIRDYYIPTATPDWAYTSAQLQAYDDIFPEHAGAGNRIIWLPDERNLGLYQNLYGIKRREVGAHIVQEIRRFDRLLTRYAELMGFTE
jgi:hypothetical protein